MTSCHSPKTASGNTYHKPPTKTLSNNSYYSNITNKFRRETLFEHGSEIWRTRRKQRRKRDKRRGGTGAQNTYTFLLMKSSATQKLWVLLASFLMVIIISSSATAKQLDVRPATRRLSGPIDANVTLSCLSSVKPVLCLWKTPYGHVYTLSEGVFAESGRLRHKKLPQQRSSSNQNECGLEIVGVEERDAGQWECEVGAVVGEDFKTSTANINLEVKVPSPQFEPGETTSRQEVGNDVILHCSANREVHLCRWKTPYLNTYIVGEGIYVERGRIQWLGSDPNYDCTIRVANLDLRDSGTWVCEIGSSTKESFQVQTKEFVIDIETPLKLSAPTSIMQNANTDATLVCHANKPFDDCLWTTPYGKTYHFRPNDPSITHENGRLAYFGFADTDCGVIVHSVQARDNGGWLCQLHSHNGEDIFQNATDIVPLFADSAATRLGAAQPRSIPDYDDYDDKTISLGGGGKGKNRNEDYDDRDFSGRVGTPAIDTFDYDNIDFDKVNKDIRKTTSTSSFNSGGFTPTTKPKIVGQIRIDRVRPGSDQGAFTKIIGNQPTPTTSNKPIRFRTSHGQTSTSTEPSISKSTLEDIFHTSGGLPMLEISKIPPTLSTADRITSIFRKIEETTTIAANPLSVLGRKNTNANKSDKELRLSGVDPLELELLSRISGTHRDTRPHRIGSGEETEGEVLESVRFESSKTTPANFETPGISKDRPEEPRRRIKVTNVNSGFTFATEKAQFRTTTPSSESREQMRLREIQRIRDERRKKAMERQREEQENQRRLEQKRKEEKARKEEEKRKSEIARQKEKKRQEELARRAEIARRKEAKRQEELARKADQERQAEIARQLEIERQAEIARQEEIARKKEKERREELARQDKIRKQKERARQEEIRRQEELAKQAELFRQKEIERIEEIERQEELERKRGKERQEELARQAKIEEEKKKKEQEELARLAELLRQEELAQKRRAEEAARREAKRKEEQRLRELRAQEEKERQRKAEKDRLRRLEEEEREKKLEAEKKKKEEERKRREEQERKKKIEAEKKRKEEDRKRREERRRKEVEKKRKEEEKRKRAEQEKKEGEERERLKQEKIQKQKQKEEREKLEAERKQKEEEFKRRLERERKRKEDAARRRAEIERKRQEQRAKRRKEAERKKKEEEERIKQEVERKRKGEEEKARKEAEKKKKEEEERKAEEERIRNEMVERRRKEKEENERIATARKQEGRRRRIQARKEREERERRRKAEADKQRKLEEERQKKIDEEKAREREKKEQEDFELRRREEDRQSALERVREERLKQLKQQQEEEDKANRAFARKKDLERVEQETRRKAFEAERDRRIQEEIRRKVEFEKQQRQEELDRRRQEKEPQVEITRASLIPRTESPRSLLQSLPITEVGDTKCYITSTPTNGNVTCNGDLIDGEYTVSSGRSCILKCRQGFVSLQSREARCMTSGRLQGRWSQRLECVTPDAMIIIGGRNSNGVLNSVELVTGRGVCRGAVPPLPAMRWRLIANTVDEDKVLACGGTNIFGDPKSNCWTLGFRGRTPFWSSGPDMLLARDAAAWALEDDYLFVMGGSLGKLKGSTNDVEMYQVSRGRWVEGPSMTSARHAHCAVGLGNGSLVVTGGYGALEVAERFDLATGVWTQLPELSPVRAQHGCALVELHGQQGVMIVGGDSGGTRLKDVRFLPLEGPNQEWQKVADLRTARWGRPGVAIVGGRITVSAGWDGRKDLDTVEYYDETERQWKNTASRLQTVRRWPASAPISIRLFPKCAQRRE